MAPMQWNDPMSGHDTLELDTADKQALLDLAHEAIRHGLSHGERMPVAVGTYSTDLQSPGASFVTLKAGGDLRGCVGSLEGQRPLAADVAGNAFAAAFRDPRFMPLASHEYARLTVSISVLSQARPVACETEEDLIAALRPGIDGLILTEGHTHRATFLPAVWESIEQPREFITQLKLKAGLAPRYWSRTLSFKRYTTTTIA